MTLESSEVQLKQRGTRTGPTMAFFFEKMSDDEWLAGTLVLGVLCTKTGIESTFKTSAGIL